MPQDKIILEGMVFYGYHGVSPEEKARGQRFVVDVELTTDLAGAGSSDELNDTIDYSEVYRLVRAVVEGRRRNLIEALAQEISSRILSEYRVEEVKVRVKKPQVSIKGSILSGAVVEIVRRRPLAGGEAT
ncbi:MAG: dihydroneopterin aldolase [Dehalococcoidia bacterium]